MRAWRQHLGLSQKKRARGLHPGRCGPSQPLYTQCMPSEPKEVAFQGLRGVQGSQLIALLFMEVDGDRPFIFGVGPPDAWKIMSALDEESLRSRSGDSFDPALSFFFFIQHLMKSMDVRLERVVITGFDGGMWKSTVYLKTAQGPRELVCRASDGVAMALGSAAKIYVTEEAISFIPTAPPSPQPGMGPQGPFGPTPGPGGPGPFAPPGPGGMPGGGPFGPSGPRIPPSPFGPRG